MSTTVPQEEDPANPPAESGDQQMETVSKSEELASQREADREERSALESRVMELEASLGSAEDEIADLQSELEELKAALHESHQSLEAAHSAADQAKQLAARHQAENEEKVTTLGSLEEQLKSTQNELKMKIDKVSELEHDIAAHGARKEELATLKRIAKKLGRQVTLLSGASSKRQTALENELFALRKKCQTQGLELDEFAAQLRTEWAVDKAQNEARMTRLRRRYERLRTLQYEDKQQMLRESQEVVRAMQSQFDEFRRLAEHLFL